MAKKNSKEWYWGAALVLCFGAALLGSQAMGSSLSTWYLQINKPFFNPPAWLFGPAWTLLFSLMAWSFVLIVAKQSDKKALPAVSLFLGQLVLNILWSWLFFYFHRPDWAFYDIIALWLAILATIILSYRLNHRAAWLLLPYIAWVSFAAVLNGAIWFLN
jgi:tryptophan-rich sensory protein